MVILLTECPSGVRISINCYFTAVKRKKPYHLVPVCVSAIITQQSVLTVYRDSYCSSLSHPPVCSCRVCILSQEKKKKTNGSGPVSGQGPDRGGLYRAQWPKVLYCILPQGHDLSSYYHESGVIIAPGCERVLKLEKSRELRH